MVWSRKLASNLGKFDERFPAISADTDCCRDDDVDSLCPERGGNTLGVAKFAFSGGFICISRARDADIEDEREEE